MDVGTASPEEVVALIVEDKRLTREYLVPPNALSDQERAEIVKVCAAAEYSSLPPSQIVPALADQGIYLASESTFYRVLRSAGLNKRRGRVGLPRKRSKPNHVAKGPLEVWVTDIERHEAP